MRRYNFRYKPKAVDPPEVSETAPLESDSIHPGNSHEIFWSQYGNNRVGRYVAGIDPVDENAPPSMGGWFNKAERDFKEKFMSDSRKMVEEYDKAQSDSIKVALGQIPLPEGGGLLCQVIDAAKNPPKGDSMIMTRSLDRDEFHQDYSLSFDDVFKQVKESWDAPAPVNGWRTASDCELAMSMAFLGSQWPTSSGPIKPLIHGYSNKDRLFAPHLIDEMVAYSESSPMAQSLFCQEVNVKAPWYVRWNNWLRDKFGTQPFFYYKDWKDIVQRLKSK